MEIYIRIKSIGKRRPILDHVPYVIPDTVRNVRELITALVETEVEKYNQKGTEMQLVPYLSREEIEEQAVIGKVGFGRIYSEKKADLRQAVETACQCYEDGMVRIFRNEEELGAPEDSVCVNEGDCFTFIRFTFLTGRLW